MKKNNFRFFNTKAIVLTVLLLVTAISSSRANWFYDRTEDHVADQHAYGDVCVRVTHVVVKIFGITVSDSMEFETFQC